MFYLYNVTQVLDGAESAMYQIVKRLSVIQGIYMTKLLAFCSREEPLFVFSLERFALTITSNRFNSLELISSSLSISYPFAGDILTLVRRDISTLG